MDFNEKLEALRYAVKVLQNAQSALSTRYNASQVYWIEIEYDQIVHELEMDIVSLEKERTNV